MRNPNATSGSRRWLVFGGLAAIVAAVLFGAYIWQNGEQDSRSDQAQAHSQRAATLTEVVTNATVARELLLQYVQDGDATLIPQIDDHARAAAGTLTSAATQQGRADLTQIGPAAAGLATGVGQVVALRQSGDVNAAAAALVQLRDPFQQVLTTLQGAIDLESAEAASLQLSADSAGSTASWLLTGAIVFGIVAGIVLAFAAFRSLGRRIAETPSPA